MKRYFILAIANASLLLATACDDGSSGDIGDARAGDGADVR